MGFVRRHLRWFLVLGTLAVALLVFVLVWFQPQKLVIEKRVNEAAPTEPLPITVTDSKGRPVLANPLPTQLEGTFESKEHETSGSAKAVPLRDNTYVLRFEDFRTSNGPDLVVYLSTADENAPWSDFAKDFVDLGPLKGNIGNQNYEIPKGTDLEKYRTVVVWCRRFTVPFAAAQLS